MKLTSVKSVFKEFRTFRTLLLLTPIIILSAISCKEKPKAGPQQPGRRAGAVNVEVMVIRTDTMQNEIFSTGTLLPNEKVELRNEVSGRVTGIFFEEGSNVDKGTLLLRINDQDLQAQLNKNSVQEKLAAAEEYRKRQLLDIKAISQEEYDVAANQLSSVRAERLILEAQLAKTQVYAPISGNIGLRQVSPGSYIPSNTLVATLQQVDPVKIEFSVPEKYTQLLRNGMVITFSMDYSAEKYNGTVYAIESGVDEVTRTIRVRARCANPKRLLVPGTFVKVRVVLEELHDAVKVPSEAVIGDIEGNKVFVVRGGKARAVSVAAGIRTNRDTQIVEGLAPGDSLIITGLLQVSDGIPVAVRGRKSPAQTPNK